MVKLKPLWLRRLLSVLPPLSRRGKERMKLQEIVWRCLAVAQMAEDATRFQKCYSENQSNLIARRIKNVNKLLNQMLIPAEEEN